MWCGFVECAATQIARNYSATVGGAVGNLKFCKSALVNNSWGMFRGCTACRLFNSNRISGSLLCVGEGLFRNGTCGNIETKVDEAERTKGECCLLLLDAEFGRDEGKRRQNHYSVMVLPHPLFNTLKKALFLTCNASK